MKAKESGITNNEYGRTKDEIDLKNRELEVLLLLLTSIFAIRYSLFIGLRLTY